jgi:hypothetical protein
MLVLHLKAFICFLPQRREDPLQSLALISSYKDAESNFQTQSLLTSDRAMNNPESYHGLKKDVVRSWSKIWAWL